MIVTANVCGLLADDPQAVIAAFAADRASLKHPPMTTDTYLAAHERARLDETVAILRTIGGELSAQTTKPTSPMPPTVSRITWIMIGSGDADAVQARLEHCVASATLC